MKWNFREVTIMKRIIGYKGSLILLLSIMFALSGCTKVIEPENPSPVNPNPPPAGAVAMLVNLPTDEELSEYNIIEKLDLQETEEGIIFVALEDGTSVDVVEISMQDDGNLIDVDTVYSVLDAPKGFAMFIKAFRSEGAPYYKLVITIKNVETIYYISYNGKDGNPKIEYIF
jgi:hypothetical protein